MSTLIIKYDDFNEEHHNILNYSILINENNRLIINIKCVDKSYQLNLSKDTREPDIMSMKSRISAELQKSMNLNQSFIVSPFPERTYVEIKIDDRYNYFTGTFTRL